MRKRYLVSAVCGLTVSAVAGVAFGTAVNDQTVQDREPGAPSQAIAPDQRLAEVLDPQGRAAWAMQVYRSNETEQCYVYGQLRNGQVGAISGDGRFTPMPTEAGSCYGPTKPRSLNVKLDTDALRGRVILHGFVGSDIRHLTLTTPRGSSIAVPKGNGALLLVTKGDSPNGTRVSASYTDGSSAVILSPPPESVPLPKKHEGPVDTGHG